VGGGGGGLRACMPHTTRAFSPGFLSLLAYIIVCAGQEKAVFCFCLELSPPTLPKKGGRVKVVCGYVQKQTRALHKYSVYAIWYEIVYRITGALLIELFYRKLSKHRMRF
jgi:hypothetical protein